MQTPPTLDLGTLLQPIPGDVPAGTDLRADASPNSAYYRVKDARTAARAAERAEIGDGGAPPEEWRTVLDLAPGLLATAAKDLEIAAWYVEALLRAEGFAGLRDGLDLLTGLVEGFWDGIHPQPDEDGHETTVAPVTGLNGAGGEGTLVVAIRRAPLVQAQDRMLSLWHLDQAIEVAKITDEARRERRISEGAATMDEVAAAIRGSRPADLLTLVEDVAAARAATLRLDAAFTARLGAEGPPLGAIRGLLQHAEDTLRFVARDRLAEALAAGDAPSLEGPAQAAPAGAAPAAGSGATTREQALRDLTRIADFFRRTEPHSPLAYTLGEAVRRANLTLPELLEELIPDSTARHHFLLAAGIRPPSE